MTTVLPADIVHSTLEWLSESDVARMARVSRWYRSIALRNRRYCVPVVVRYIDYDNEDHSMEGLHDRTRSIISYFAAHPTPIDLHLSCYRPGYGMIHAPAPKDFFQVLQHLLPFTLGLTIHTCSSYIEYFWTALSSPALMLRKFRMLLVHSGYTGASCIRSDLFQRSAPKLTDALISGLMLPEEGVGAFARVHTFTLLFDSGYNTKNVELYKQFPGLKDLTIDFQSVERIDNRLDCSGLQLKWLDIQGESDITGNRVLPHFTNTSVPFILCSHYLSCLKYADAWVGVTGPLYVHTQMTHSDSASFKTSIISQEGGFERHFSNMSTRDFYPLYARSDPLDPSLTAQLAALIVDIRLHHYFFPALIMYGGTLPELRRLRIDVQVIYNLQSEKVYRAFEGANLCSWSPRHWDLPPVYPPNNSTESEDHQIQCPKLEVVDIVSNAASHEANDFAALAHALGQDERALSQRPCLLLTDVLLLPPGSGIKRLREVFSSVEEHKSAVRDRTCMTIVQGR